MVIGHDRDVVITRHDLRPYFVAALERRRLRRAVDGDV